MIYIDLDGVLVDFDPAVREHCGGLDFSNTSKDEIWDCLEKVPNLFIKMERTWYASLIIDLAFSLSKLNPITENIPEILTALPKRTSGFLWQSQRDKVEWVNQNISSVRSLQVNCVPEWERKKYFCRNKWDVLIDDHSRNIIEWSESGGLGILVTGDKEKVIFEFVSKEAIDNPKKMVVYCHNNT